MTCPLKTPRPCLALIAMTLLSGAVGCTSELVSYALHARDSGWMLSRRVTSADYAVAPDCSMTIPVKYQVHRPGMTKYWPRLRSSITSKCGPLWGRA